MQETGRGLEERLIQAEAEADGLLKDAADTLAAIKLYRTAVREGDLREMSKAMEAIQRSVTSLTTKSAHVRAAWNMEEEAYLASAAFRTELTERARAESLQIFEHDERLYCYPLIIRVVPRDRVVLFDKRKERKIRPSLLVKKLKELQNRPTRFKPDVFLEILFTVYSGIVGNDSIGRLALGKVVGLSRLYALLTPLPGQSKEYTRQEFARDIYSLDQSGINRTKAGHVLSLPASTGTKSADDTITVIAPTGEEKKYYGIAFSNSNP
jgi:hypothetical protein